MITKGIVEEIRDNYYALVRLPVYNGVSIGTNFTPKENLNVATLCTLPNTHPNLQIGDVVFVGFEDNDMGKPVILGCLYRETLSDSYASITLNSLEVIVDSHLSADTSIGNTTSFDIQNLSNTRDNLQSQIDILKEEIEKLRDDFTSFVQTN